MASDPPIPSTLASEPTLDGTSLREKSEPAEPRIIVSARERSVDPTRVGRYVILRRLGQGGMGVVFLAYDPDLDRKVAIKLVRESAGESTLGRARVKQEAQALAQVSHPNVVHVYEVGESAGQLFLAMEYIPGVPLSTWQSPKDGTPPPVAQVLRVYLQAAAGLLAAHRSGLIHRDFKPDQITAESDR